MTPTLYAACGKAVHVVQADGSIVRAGLAALFILEHIGWGWFARLLTRPPFIWFVELGYSLIANNRPFFARLFFRREPKD